VVVDDEQSTSVPGVWAAGELTGVAGADKAVAEGHLAGAAILASTVGPAVPSGARRAVRRWDGFRDALARLYPWDDEWTVGLPDEVTVCRCEEVPAEAVRRAIADGATNARAVKGLTRCGMGRCQGGVCGPLVSSMVRAAGHPSPGHLESRPVAQPVLVDQLARLTANG
jgi:NAD(P)H-nitrite reductase large subunit